MVVILPWPLFVLPPTQIVETLAHYNGFPTIVFVGGLEIMETCTLVMPPQKRGHLRPICRCKGASQSYCLLTYLSLGLWFICLRWYKAHRWGTFSGGGLDL
jgi:hypothetical protein